MDKQLALAPETQGGTAQGQTELSSPSSNKFDASQKRAREIFVCVQENRLHKLISQGHLCIGSRSLVWVDENGLLTAQNMDGKNPQQQTPLFYAGPDADVNEISNTPRVLRHCWGKERPRTEWLVSGSLLETLVMKQIKYLPLITHLTWKNLLTALESATTTHIPISVMLKMLKDAITEAKDDWRRFEYFVDNCGDQEKFFDIDLDAFSEALYRTAGVDPNQGKPWATLRDIDESLADQIFTLCHLANRTQSEELSPEQLPLLGELADGLSDILSPPDSRMERLFEVVEAKALGRS